MSERKLNDWLQGYQDFTEDFEAPPSFAKWVGIATLSVAAGHKVWLAEANNRVWPNLYVILVGPSGVGKGQAMREALPFLDKTGVPRSPDQVTIQRMMEHMTENPTHHEQQGLITPYLIWAEELPSFLGMDAWKSGKLADLTTIFDCAPQWESQTISRKETTVIQPYVCMLAGSTPSGIYDVLPPASVGQGFTSRIIFAWASNYTKRVPVKPWTEKHQKLHTDLMNDIEIISKIEGPMMLSDIATVRWADYYRHRPDPTEEFGDSRMQGFAARKPFYVKKLAVLMRLSDPEPGMEIQGHHLERALQLIDEVSGGLQSVYSEIAPNNLLRHRNKVIEWMLKMGGLDILHSELMQKFSHALTAREFKEVIEGLVDENVVQKHETASGGRFKVQYSLTKKMKGR